MFSLSFEFQRFSFQLFSVWKVVVPRGNAPRSSAYQAGARILSYRTVLPHVPLRCRVEMANLLHSCDTERGCWPLLVREYFVEDCCFAESLLSICRRVCRQHRFVRQHTREAITHHAVI